jgi:hypothetical protein
MLLRWTRVGVARATLVLVALVALVSVALAALVLMAAPGAAEAEVSYGLGDAQGQFAHYYANPWFKALTRPASAHRVTYLRFFVAYDAVAQWNGSTTAPGCVDSRVLTQPWVTSLEAAFADGLTPVVSINGYGPSAIPSWDQEAPDPTTTGGYWEYRCGVEGIIDSVDQLPAAEQPHIWEAMNEPDILPVYSGNTADTDTSCNPALEGAVDGPAKGACDYVIGSQIVHAAAGHSTDTVLAGVFSRPTSSYLADYEALLSAQLPAAGQPGAWSVHDYADVTGSYAGPVRPALAGFDQALASLTHGSALDLWVTEAGTRLVDSFEPGPCPAVSPDPAGSLGACVNGQPARQANAAAGFFDLPLAGTGVPITHLFWYEWEGESSNWDSGLVDNQGHLRVAWCAFYGSGTCTGSPDAA